MKYVGICFFLSLSPHHPLLSYRARRRKRGKHKASDAIALYLSYPELLPTSRKVLSLIFMQVSKALPLAISLPLSYIPQQNAHHLLSHTTSLPPSLPPSLLLNPTIYSPVRPTHPPADSKSFPSTDSKTSSLSQLPQVQSQVRPAWTSLKHSL